MSFQGKIVAAIAVGVAVASFLLAAIVFLSLRRYEALNAAKKEALMAPVVREERSREWYTRRTWLKNFHEEELPVKVGETFELSKRYAASYEMEGFYQMICKKFCVKLGTPPRYDPATVSSTGVPSYDHIPAALSRFFDGQLDLGIDHRVLMRLLLSDDQFTRFHAVEFVMNKAILSFSNLRSHPKYAILPPKILDLASEISVRGHNACTTMQDYTTTDPRHEENHFLPLFNRWRILTYKLYGRDDFPPELQERTDRCVDFILAVLDPILKLETMAEARAALQKKMIPAVKMALFCAGQHALIETNWDFMGPGSKVVYVGEPERIPPFDMMAEKTLVVSPAWLQTHHAFDGRPFVNAFVEQEAEIRKFTDKQWAKLTEGLDI